MANIDITAADTFFAAKCTKKKINVREIQDLLLAATAKYLEPLGMQGEDLPQMHPWIDFKEVAEDPQAAKDPGRDEPNSAPTVIHFDEQSGAQLNQQLEFPGAEKINKKERDPPVVLPCREWRRQHESMGAVEADESSAVVVLHSLHETFDVESQPIELFHKDQQNYVTATCQVEANAIWLPPCVPKQAKVFERSEHPYAVQLTEKSDAINRRFNTI